MIADTGKLFEMMADVDEVDDVIGVEPGSIAFIRQRGGFKSVVGSGVAVCLLDRSNNVAAMNHFLFPRTDDPQKATGRYGNAALIAILSLLERHGSSISPVAYIVGGAYCDEFEIDSVMENISIALKFLQIRQIPIIAQYLGGNQPWNVSFDIESGIFTARCFRNR